MSQQLLGQSCKSYWLEPKTFTSLPRKSKPSIPDEPMDKRFRIDIIRKTENPQQLIWLAMHQDYCEDMAVETLAAMPSTESKAGELIIKHLLKGGRGHYGPLEHPTITLNAGYFPHSVMQQIRTHRVGITFDCQSFRYTGQRIIDAATGKRDLKDVFYLRPAGFYTDRQGHKYQYSEIQRLEDLNRCYEAAKHYRLRISQGLSEEHARGLIPFDIRQHFVFSVNVRSLMHLLDLRLKKDAQLEAQQFSELLLDMFKQWCPELAAWYVDNRALKGVLAP